MKNLEKQKKILITGASGYVGSRIYQSLKESRYDITGVYCNKRLFHELIQVDITDSKQVNHVFDSIKPQIILHFASVSRSQDALSDPDRTYQVNVKACENIVSLAQRSNAKVVYISTFACFEPDTPLGKSKFQAEKIIKTLKNYVILRPSYVVGISPNKINNSSFNEYLQKFIKHEVIEADSSWKFEVTYMEHLFQIIEAIIHNPKINSLIIPVIAQGVTTQYQLAKDLFGSFGTQVREIDKKRKLPLPILDVSMYDRFNLPKYTYENVIEGIKKELQSI